MEKFGRIIILLGLVQTCQGSGGKVVIYHGDNAPNYWGKFSENCLGSHQSPIDFKSSEVHYSATIGQITFGGYDQEQKAGSLILTHDANTVSVAVSTDEEITISDGGLDATYRLEQFHIHWGLNDYRGSEHTVNGAAYPAEMHFVHYNTKYDGVHGAQNYEDGLAVLGVFIEVDHNSTNVNKGFETMHRALRRTKFPGRRFHIDKPLSLSQLLPENTEEFFRYQGSLTTPTCNEVVTWTVFNKPIVITYQQMQYLREFLVWKGPSGAYTTHADNYRPVQPLNCRSVYKTFQGTPNLPSTANHGSRC